MIVARAIRVYLDVGCAGRDRPEVALLHFGTAADVTGMRLEDIHPETVAEVVDAHPRQCFKQFFADKVRAEAKVQPLSNPTMATLLAFPDPDRFDPQRFVDGKPNTFAWVPFGGGTRRCMGAAFARMEIDVVLRTVLRTVAIHTTTKPGERSHNRGVAYNRTDGGRIVVHHRNQEVKS